MSGNPTLEISHGLGRNAILRHGHTSVLALEMGRVSQTLVQIRELARVEKQTRCRIKAVEALGSNRHRRADYLGRLAGVSAAAF